MSAKHQNSNDKNSKSKITLRVYVRDSAVSEKLPPSPSPNLPSPPSITHFFDAVDPWRPVPKGERLKAHHNRAKGRRVREVVARLDPPDGEDKYR